MYDPGKIGHMRDISMTETRNYAGQLLVAHPKLGDPNFRKTVILISAHSDEEGCLGVILNRPLGKTLGELNFHFSYSSLGSVPVYEGGPVQENELILAAWYWEPESRIFRLYFGIDEAKARELQMMQPEAEFRAFLGYAGWTQGQLEKELAEEAWIMSKIEEFALKNMEGGEKFWKKIILKENPELGFLSDIPEDPSLN